MNMISPTFRNVIVVALFSPSLISVRLKGQTIFDTILPWLPADTETAVSTRSRFTVVQGYAQTGAAAYSALPLFGFSDVNPDRESASLPEGTRIEEALYVGRRINTIPGKKGLGLAAAMERCSMAKVPMGTYAQIARTVANTEPFNLYQRFWAVDGAKLATPEAGVFSIEYDPRNDDVGNLLFRVGTVLLGIWVII